MYQNYKINLLSEYLINKDYNYFMYFPDKYEEHNKALKKFIKLFNEKCFSNKIPLKMYQHINENFYDDGTIIYQKDKSEISFDFEKRYKYFDSYGFKFKKLGQFERKIVKTKIKLSIQCSTDETSFLIAWHEDFLLEKKIKIFSSTENILKENNPKRFTENFKEIKYNDMLLFIKILVIAFENNKFNKTSFS